MPLGPFGVNAEKQNSGTVNAGERTLSWTEYKLSGTSQIDEIATKQAGGNPISLEGKVFRLYQLSENMRTAYFAVSSFISFIPLPTADAEAALKDMVWLKNGTSSISRLNPKLGMSKNRAQTTYKSRTHRHVSGRFFPKDLRGRISIDSGMVPKF